MSDDRSTLGPDGVEGRTDTGRFAKGNKLGRGNPLAGKVAKLRSQLLAKCDDTNAIPRVVDALVKKAVEGDVYAARLLFEYALGKPIELDVVGQLEEVGTHLRGEVPTAMNVRTRIDKLVRLTREVSRPSTEERRAAFGRLFHDGELSGDDSIDNANERVIAFLQSTAVGLPGEEIDEDSWRLDLAEPANVYDSEEPELEGATP